jgi:hypothetical protein
MKIKTFTVDLNSEEECKKVINILRSNLGDLSKNISGSKKDKVKAVFDACQKIYDTDISNLYKHLKLDASPVYYVYTHSQPSDKIAIGHNGISTFAATLGMDLVPFYVGKGTGNRAYDLNRNETHRKVRQKLSLYNLDISVKIIKENLTELEALMLESKLIDMFGLISQGGRLVNLDEGVNNKERKQLYYEELQKINKIYQ